MEEETLSLKEIMTTPLSKLPYKYHEEKLKLEVGKFNLDKKKKHNFNDFLRDKRNAPFYMILVNTVKEYKKNNIPGAYILSLFPNFHRQHIYFKLRQMEENELITCMKSGRRKIYSINKNCLRGGVIMALARMLSKDSYIDNDAFQKAAKEYKEKYEEQFKEIY